MKKIMKKGYDFIMYNFKSYNKFLYELLYSNSIGGKKLSSDGNTFYNVYTAYSFILLLLLTYIYSNSGYSYSFITGVISAAYASFYAFSHFIVIDKGISGKYDGWNTLRKFMPSLFFSLIVVLVCFYFSEYSITFSLLKNILHFLVGYTFIFYLEGFIAFTCIQILTIDYPNMFEGKGFTFKHIIYYVITYFFVWLADSLYGNIMKFGMEWSYWAFSIDSLFYIYKILAFIVFGLVASSWFVGVVEFIYKPENKNILNWVHVCLSILVIMFINYNYFIFYFIGIIVIYFVFFYVIEKIIPDYLRSYKYLNSILYLFFFLFFLSFIVI